MIHKVFSVENDHDPAAMASVVPLVVELLTDISEQYHAEVRKAYE